MSASMLLGMFSWVGDFFRALGDLIPKVIYLFWASLACVLDVLQLFFRKLAGLDVYYITENGKTTMVAGDIVTQFIAGILGWDIGAGTYNYSTLSTVFYSMILFGIIVCFGCILIAIIKSHYSYDEKSAKGPMQYVYAGIKSVVNMVAVPVIVVLGLYVSQALLQALDSITATTSDSIIQMYGKTAVDTYLESTKTSRSQAAGSTNADEVTYLYYDVFGFASDIVYGANGFFEDVMRKPTLSTNKEASLTAATTETFSGSMFKVAAYNANRVRLTKSISAPLIDELFSKAKETPEDQRNEVLANMIDTAFANNLHLKEFVKADYVNGAWSSSQYFSMFYAEGFRTFSKFNVGAVWLYYDLWNFNFIVGFASIIVGASLFVNIIMGLIARIFMCVGLFLISPPLFGLAPLDGGKAGKSWRENFMKQVLMTYGAVVGMNIFFLLLPYFNKISFFNIAIADYFAQTLVIIVGLVTIKAFIAVCSALIGAEDANASGQKIAGEVGGTVKGAAKLTGAAAKFAWKHSPAGIVTHAGVQAAKMGIKKAGDAIENSANSSNVHVRRFGAVLRGAGKGIGGVVGFAKDPNSMIDAGMSAGMAGLSKIAQRKKIKHETDETDKKGKANIERGQKAADALLDAIANGIKDKSGKVVGSVQDMFNRVRDGSMSDNKAKDTLKGMGFNNTQTKEMLDLMKQDNMKFDNFKNIANNASSASGGAYWKSEPYKDKISKTYLDNQKGYLKDANSSYKQATAVGSSGIGALGTEAYKNVLTGDTFKVFDEARKKKKEEGAQAKEQKRHEEEMGVLSDIAKSLKSKK
ncbi:MAG: hypothetical protein K2K31_00870 [Clostridia bacterium]|nr:hypothetical protein [Clostridia bacterium]